MALAISEVAVANLALIKLGQDPISSLTQDTTNARLVNAVFEFCRNETLESYPWSFATKTVEMASVDDEEDNLGEWNYAYQLPADFISMIKGEDWKQDYEIRDGYLFSNDEPMYIEYIYENDNPQQWSYAYAMCLSWRIAAEVSYAITQSTTVAEAMMRGFEMSLKAARYANSRKKSPEGPVIDSFVDVRN
jgi:hypothetical protein